MNSGGLQVVLDDFWMLKKDRSVIWLDTLILPAYFTALSALVLLIYAILLSNPIKRFYKAIPTDSTAERNRDTDSVGFFAEAREHVSEHGGPVIFAYMIARLIGCLTMLGLSLASFVMAEELPDTNGIDMLWKGKHKENKNKHGNHALSQAEWLQVAMCINSLYTSFLALISVLARPRCSRLVTNHLVAILLVTFSVYVYRDLVPLTTFSEHPQDRGEGWILWAKAVAITLTAVVIPLTIPRQYIPFDPEDPSPEPSPEQTTSLASLILYSFLDPIIFLAYRIPHLPHDQLPPLADYDYAKNLMKTSFPHLDPFTSKKRKGPHIFFGLMKVFRREYIILSIMTIIQVVTAFAGPLGVNRLLYYLEQGGQNTVVRPWVWIICLAAGPIIGRLAFQWYIYITTRTLVRTEGIITQLVFEHSLRIRVKAEISENTTSSSEDSTAIPTPDNASVTEGTERQEGSSGNGDETLTVQSSLASIKSSKGKQKAKGVDSAEDIATHQKQTSADNLVGKINNLVTTDLGNLVDGRDFLFLVLYIPVQIVLCILFLYVILGWSAFVGLVTMLLLFPIPGYVAGVIQKVQVTRMKKTDARVQTVTETMNVLRMIKLFGWESKMNEKIANKREEELTWLWKRRILDLMNGVINYVIPVVTMLATYSTYTLVMKQELNASQVFSSMTVFDMLRDQLYILFFTVAKVVQAKVSLDRIDDFLKNTELLDSFAEKANGNESELFTGDVHPEDVIGFRRAIFSWSNESNGFLTPSRRNFNLQIADELTFKRDCINLIIGPTGSGKTSLLMALLGEMHFIPSGPDSWVNLPRGGGVAYAAQESWVQNETIRANIVFGAPFDEARYNKVIYQCGLERDLILFEAGDRTEVGEKGLTISGGQKARITLARAVYSSADILLLDDVLAALDVHTSKWVIDKCFKGDLLRGRTVLLVTHNVAMASPIADFVVSLGPDGQIFSQGSVSDIVAKDRMLGIEDQEKTEKTEDAVDLTKRDGETEQSDGKLIVKEEIEEGHISWPALKLFILGMSGGHPVLFWLAFLGGMFLTELSGIVQTWYLGYLASQYEHHPAAEVAVSYYLTTYGLILLFAVIVYTSSYSLYFYGSLRASRTVHKKLVESVLGTTLRWLDTTPTSRVIARCTQDIRAVDDPISYGLGGLIEVTIAMFMRLGAVIVFTPVFVVPGAVVAILGYWSGQIYMKAQLSVKREMSNAKSPVLSHFGAAIAGLTSIRAYGAQHAFKKESMTRIDSYTRAARTFYNLNRWISARIEALGGVFAAGLATYIVYGKGTLPTASDTGFSLNMAVGFSSMILWWVRSLNEFEVNGNSLERIQGYVTIEQEPKPTAAGNPPAYWPASGDILVEDLSARYSLDGPEVLHNISFHIKSGERVGVVGRTGSGKSSLTLSLLRCIFTEGTIYYDGLPIDSLNLDVLRSNITIIPQIPELLTGTLRTNLDPFDQYDDAVLNDALRAAGLYSLQGDTDEAKITLDSTISSGGRNLSVGQRQILALARALVRGSKLFVLDEATSAIDYKTDEIIQASLRHELKTDVSLITVAHRLQTIMDADKIMVLDAGRIIEFDSPEELLKSESGMFRALVDESGDKDKLYAMVKRKMS